MIDKIVCKFKPGRPATLESVEIIPAKSEGGAADKPQTFRHSPQMNSRQGAKEDHKIRLFLQTKAKTPVSSCLSFAPLREIPSGKTIGF